MSDDARAWMIAHAGPVSGPLTTAELVRAVLAGRVPRSASAWTEGMPAWIPVTEIPEVRAALGRGFDGMATRQLLVLGGLSVGSGLLLFIANVVRALAGHEVGPLWAGLAGAVMAPGALMLWKALRRR